MAAIDKRSNGRWRVRIRNRRAPALSKTFTRKADAMKWARDTEILIEQGHFTQTDNKLITLKDILEKYRKEITSKKRGREQEEYRIKQMMRHSISLKEITVLSPTHFAYYRDERLKQVSPTTVRKECALFSHALNIAKNEWGCLIGNNPLSMIKLPTNNPSRTRRLLQGEYEALKHACKQNPNPWFYPLFILAIETGMRRSELLNIEWQNININNSLCRVLYTKNGEERIIPLSAKAIDVLKQLPRAIKGKVFPLNKTTVRSLWERTCKKTNIKGLRFHDLRHEATSRLFEKGLSIMEVASITGHKDIRMLRTYTHLQTNNLVKKLDTESIEYI